VKTILVGNGPSLVGAKRGSLIDSFARIARFNNFRINGFEEDVGRRTDLWLTHEGYLTEELSWSQSFSQPETWVLAPDLPRRRARMLASARASLPCVHLVSLVEARCISSAWDATAAPQSPDYVWPSTGIMAILLFKPCVIIGFDHFMTSSQHYWSKTISVDTYHSRERERDIVEALTQSRDVIRLG
jgi:hypothetical protein